MKLTARFRVWIEPLFDVTDGLTGLCLGYGVAELLWKRQWLAALAFTGFAGLYYLLRRYRKWLVRGYRKDLGLE